MDVMQFKIEGDVAIMRFDDGKANAIGHAFVDAMNEGLDRAEKEAKAVLIIGRPGRFSAGFDLSEFKKGPEASQALLKKGSEMFLRMYGHPQPLVAACTGHAIAAGAFLLLSCDTRIGTLGDFKLGLNETAIGMNFPVFGHELASSRISKRHLTAVLVQSTMYNPGSAMDAGFLDEAVAPEELEKRSLEVASQLALLPGAAYAKNKLDTRAISLQKIRESIQ
ncbi:MAG: crotonase/enoyl-CoA hydratase family protein [Pseudomonadales bacterium]|jgi:enoyl-CoA hydratase